MFADQSKAKQRRRSRRHRSAYLTLNALSSLDETLPPADAPLPPLGALRL
jgi:hypothetical protein